MVEPVRVLHVITSLRAGGAERMLQKLVTALGPLRYTCTVVSLTEASTVGAELREQGIEVEALGGRGGILLPHHAAALMRSLRRARPHVVHSWMYHANVVAHGMVRLNPWGIRPALIASVRGALHAVAEQKRSLRLTRAVDSKLSRWADAIVFNSQRAAEQHGALGYDMRRAVVIPNCFDTERFRPSPQARERLRAELGCPGALLIGLVARFDRMKDHRNFLRAARLVAARHASCRFVLVGRGCGERDGELPRMIRALDLSGVVYLLGERNDVAGIQAALDVAVCSSVSESFPNAIGEAMACGVPCVVTDVGDCGVLVGDTGRVVPPREPAALANAMLELCEMSSEARQELGVRARHRVMAEFSIAPVVRKFTDLYEACVSSNLRSAHSQARRVL